MAMAFLGRRKGERRLAREAHTDASRGTRHQGMIETACAEGFHCYVNSDSTVEEVKHFLSLGLPVVVDFTEPSGGEGHYSVVSGYKNGRLSLSDPWNGRNTKLSVRDFERRWHDSLTRSRGWMMALSVKDFGLGKQYHPHGA